MSTENENGNFTNPMSGAARVRMMDYMIHFKTDEHVLEFQVYPCQDWVHLPTGKKGTGYIDKKNEPELREVFEEGKCLMKMRGSFCSRGVWEGRLYFTDKEYWGEDIAELSELYNGHIVEWCKDFIKKRESSNYFENLT